MLCMRKFMPVPGVCQEPFRPEKPSVTAYMLFSKGLLKLKRSKYAATGCSHRPMKVCITISMPEVKKALNESTPYHRNSQ